jgi:tRNA1Val (adenine37-N6)-methyltransferase
MANDYFQCKQFTVWQQYCAMKVTTDGCLFGAWVARQMLDTRCWMLDTGSLMLDAGYCKPDESSLIRHSSFPIQHSLLDIGTGTGLLSLMLAQKTSLSIDAVEIDPAAAEQAAQNIAASPWADRIRVINGNITTVALNGPYPIIISNPPFFENQLASPDAGRQQALHAKELSLSALFRAIVHWLTPQGTLFLLLPAYRHAELENLASQNGLYPQVITWVKQTPRHEPFRMMVQLGMDTQNLSESELIIKKSSGGYSTEFVELLKDYYLRM